MRILKDYLFILVGDFILAMGIGLFLAPCKLCCGGVSAIGTILLYVFNIPLSLSCLILNLLLFLFSFGVLGKGYLLKTAVGTAFLSLFLEIASYIKPPSLDFFCSLILGGTLVGAGVGLIIRFGGSSGGSDLLALAIRRTFNHISLPTIILVLDLFVILLAGIVFRDASVFVYSAVSMIIAAKSSDVIISFGTRAKTVIISSQKSEEVKCLILEKFERGVTEIYTRGGFSQENRLLIFSVLSPKEIARLTRKIKEIDPEAFVVTGDAKEVFGKGFSKFD